MKTEKITFPGYSGEHLAGRLDMPDGQAKATIIFAHCFTCGKDLAPINRIARSVTEAGYRLFRFDFTGLGASEGEFANTTFSSNVADLVAAADYLRSNNMAPGLLLGHSLGGTAVLTAAQHIPETDAVAVIGAPFDATHVSHHFHAHTEEIKQRGYAKVELAGRQFTIKKEFLDDIADQHMATLLPLLGKPLLIMHSPQDDTVELENARLIYDHAQHPKSFIALDKADHLLMKNPQDSQYVAAILCAWAERYC
jgi:putative redox protein